MRLPDAVVGRIFEPAWDVYERSTRLRELRRLRRTQWEKPEAVRARQEAALRAMVTHAASTCAFYRDSFAQAGVDPASVRTLDDLAHLPIVTKDDIRQRGDDLISSRHRKQDLRRAASWRARTASGFSHCVRRSRRSSRRRALRS